MKKRFLFYIILFCLISFSNAFSQKISIGKLNNYWHSTLDENRGIIYAYGKGFLKEIHLENLKVDSIPLIYDVEFDTSRYKPVLIDSTHYFIHEEGGLVFQKRNDSIVRIDNSFNHLMQCQSNIFEYNGKIHRFGGYGFWGERNIITYFDPKLREWDVVNPTHTEVIPNGISAGIHKVIGDKFYVFNGYRADPKNLYKYLLNEHIYSYDFKTQTWEYLGDFKQELINLKLDVLKYNVIIDYEDKLLLSLLEEVKILDFTNNKISTHEKGAVPNTMWGILGAHFYNNRFYYFSAREPDTLFLGVATIDEFIGPQLHEEKIYKKQELLQLLLVLSGGIILMYLIFRAIKIHNFKNGRILIMDNGLKYKNRFVEFDETLMNILNLLISNESVQSNEILSLVQQKQYSRAQNERVKFQKVEEMNLKLKTLLSTDKEMVISRKSDFDRRIREYILLNKSQFLIK